MLRGGWFELPVGPEMILGPSEHEDAGERDRFVHVGIPVTRKQIHCGVPHVLTPWLAPLRGFDHDAFANMSLAALRRRLAQYRESETTVWRVRRRLLHLTSQWRLTMQKPYEAQLQSSTLRLAQIEPALMLPPESL